MKQSLRRTLVLDNNNEHDIEQQQIALKKEVHKEGKIVKDEYVVKTSESHEKKS
jgi:hypothetical protein